MQEAIGDPVQDCVPVVNSRCHEGMEEGFAGGGVQAFSNLGYAKQVKVGASAGVRHLSRHIESVVQNHADVTDGRQQRYNGSADVDSGLIRSYAGGG